jgi:hypothetical protein
MSDAIQLPGLIGSHPLGALAAFGLLRCCDELAGWKGSRLSWRQESEWLAVLTPAQPATGDDLIAALCNRQGERPAAKELNWADNIRTGRDCYLAAAAEAGVDLRAGRRAYADFLAAFACDFVGDDAGELRPTAFYMTSGQQKFLKEARNVARAVASGISIGRRRKGTDELFREALFGPWSYEDPQHSLGWDPSTERLHALRARSPTKEASAGIAGAVWLAFEALPFFPCFLSRRGLVTTGFRTQSVSRRERVTQFTWPLWEEPVTADTLRSLLSLDELTQEKPPARVLRARGIAAAFRSERHKVKGQGSYYILRPASPCL